MLRFPNPGSDINSFIRIFYEIFDALKDQESFSLDDITSTLVERNLATSCGFAGEEALSHSTRKDRSRDPLYNQSKMYSELFKILGWIHPFKGKQLDFQFTFFGAHVVRAIQDPAAIFRESALGVAYPNEILDVKGNHQLRPFATILRTLGALDGLLARDELIIGPMCLDNDRDDNLFSNMIQEIHTLRGYWKALDNKMKEIANQRNIKPNTMKNYTRFPLAVLRWTGWTKDETIKVIYDKAIKFDKLTEKGKMVLEFLEKCRDIRKFDLEKINRETRNAIIRFSFYQMLGRAGFDTAPVDSMLSNDKTLITSYLGSENRPVLFSPFQEMSSDYLLNIFPNPSGSETTQARQELITSTTNVERREFLYSNVELKISSASDLKIVEPTDFRNKMLNQNIDAPILNLFEMAITKYRSLDPAIEPIAIQYLDANQDKFYPLIVKLFNAIGYDCKLSRPGVNYERWDAMIIDKQHSMPIEIKSPGEEIFLSVKAIRQALENKVILLARSAYPTKFHDTSLVVCYNLPNNRSEVNSLINDIFETYKIVIGVIDFRSLLKIAGSQLFLTKQHRKDQLEKLHGIIKLSNS